MAFVLLGCGLAVGQTYVFQRQFDVETLDPLGDYSPWGQSVIENVYEGLYGVEGATVNLTPLLATSHDLSEDGRMYTFYLRQGVTFHSGNPFTCADVEYSLKRALIVDPGFVGMSLIGTASDALSELGADGTAEEYAAYWANIARSITCLNDFTVTVTSIEPDPILFAALMSPRFFIVDKALVTANGGWDGTEATWRELLGTDLADGYLHDHMSGTGAYQLVSWEPEARLIAERNDAYWGAAPSIETIVYEVVPDEDERIEALLAGKVDQVDIRMTPVEEIQGEPGIKVITTPEGAPGEWGIRVVGAVFLNQAMNPVDNALIGSGELDGAGVPANFFSDVNVRKCFAYAWDTGEDDPQYEGDGSFYANMLLLPFFPAYDPTIPRYKLDLAKAEEHCRAAWGGELWENGMHLRIPSADWIGMFFKETLEPLNPKFTIEPVEVTGEEYFRMWVGNQLPWINAAGYASFPDAFEFMTDWYLSSTSLPGTLGYVNDEIDKLIIQARSEFDSATRDELYRQVGRLAYEDAPFVLLPSFPYAIVVSDNVTGAYRNPMFVDVRWADLSKAE